MKRAKPKYYELHCRSAFSFLRGASQPEELAQVAAGLDLPGIAVCDRDGLYGTARVHAAAREAGTRAIVGAELTMESGGVVPVLVRTRAGYQNLCRLITDAKLRGTKHAAPVRWEDLRDRSEGMLALSGDGEGAVQRALAARDYDGARVAVERLAAAFGGDNVYVEVQRHLERGEGRRISDTLELAQTCGHRVVATNGVSYATGERRELLDVFTCIREHTHLDAAGRLLAANSERYLKSAERMATLFRDCPEAIENTVRVADRIEFSLENLGYEFPKYPVPDGESMDAFLRARTYEGAKGRFPKMTQKVRAQLDHELTLIAKLGFSGYFLIVWDIANFCRDEGILMQGRGSAANSAVCFSLGITAVDPVAGNLLFERFLSEGRKSWPDIDLDLPSGDRRERVIQEVYRRYGKHGAAMTANVITYRGRSAMREIGKALNFPSELLDRFSRLFGGGDYRHTLDLEEHMEKAGIAATHPRTAVAQRLVQQVVGLPRHLGQHSGGMIICQGALSSVMPLERASMPGRVVAQWDKDDCEDLGIIKVDLLGLGMMAVMQDTLELCERRGCPVDLAKIPKDDAATYELMQRADTIGVFQIESRAQMATLPRMKPKCFYDVVIEVAIIRPGPIQGDMVHPFLARRSGAEPVTYFDDRLEPVLARTLGVPLFQEQLLKMAMVMANFSGSEAEELRRALSFHRSQERMAKVCVKLRDGMLANGVREEIADQVVKSVQSFAVYGFPESHAISFALIAYASAWMKVHRTAEFFAGLLNNQPMGFYSSATLVRDAKAHRVKIRPVSVIESGWHCDVPEDRTIRLGLCVVRGLSESTGRQIVHEREQAPFLSVEDFRKRVPADKPVLRTLARIGAFNGLVGHRRDGLWQVEGHVDADALLDGNEAGESPLPPMDAIERIHADFDGTGMTTGPHPMALVRDSLPELWRAADLELVRHGQRIEIGGLVICRQRPGTAKGFVFVSVEDETGVANALLAPDFFESHRLIVTQESFLRFGGQAQVNADGVVLVKADAVGRLQSPVLESPRSHDFH